jgi:transposase InsO family protein
MDESSHNVISSEAIPAAYDGMINLLKDEIEALEDQLKRKAKEACFSYQIHEDEMNSVKSRVTSLQTEISSLKTLNEHLSNHSFKLETENSAFKDKIGELEKLLDDKSNEFKVLETKLSEFDKSTKCLNQMINNGQSCKSGIGFDKQNAFVSPSKSSSKVIFVKANNDKINGENKIENKTVSKTSNHVYKPLLGSSSMSTSHKHGMRPLMSKFNGKSELKRNTNHFNDDRNRLNLTKSHGGFTKNNYNSNVSQKSKFLHNSFQPLSKLNDDFNPHYTKSFRSDFRSKPRSNSKFHSRFDTTKHVYKSNMRHENHKRVYKCTYCHKLGHLRYFCYRLQETNLIDRIAIAYEKLRMPGKFSNSIKNKKHDHLDRIEENCMLQPRHNPLHAPIVNKMQIRENTKHVPMKKQLRKKPSHDIHMNTKNDNTFERKALGNKKPRSIWIKKTNLYDHSCDIVLKAIDTSNNNQWYLDSGCSRHMSGNKSLFSSLEKFLGGKVMFGDGLQANIIGKGCVKLDGLPTLENVMLVDGLKANLLSISQLCDSGMLVNFTKNVCHVLKDNKIIFEGRRNENNCYIVDNLLNCNLTTLDDTTLWHRRLGHLNFKTLSELTSLDIIKGVPSIKRVDKMICEDCQLGKQNKASHKKLTKISTKEPLELLHMDLMGPTQTISLCGKAYILVIVDDFSRFTWIAFLKHKSDAFAQFYRIAMKIQNEKDTTIKRVRSDRGGEFMSKEIIDFCIGNGIKHEFSAPYTPQANGVVERKNRTIQNMARVMMNSKHLPKYFWVEACRTSVHTINRVFVRPMSNLTPYELYYHKKPNVRYFRTFGSNCYILNDRDNLGKFENKGDKAIFLGYAIKSRGYRVWNLRTESMMESQNVVINDTLKLDEPCFDFGGDDDSSLDENDHLNVSKEIKNDGKILNDQSVPISEHNDKSETKNEQISNLNNNEDGHNSISTSTRDEDTNANKLKVSTSTRNKNDLDPNLVIGDIHDNVKTRSKFKDKSMISYYYTCFFHEL